MLAVGTINTMISPCKVLLVATKEVYFSYTILGLPLVIAKLFFWL
ncbi:MAG: hypothetical protein ACI9LM_000195 [Alteromonadaceae bacterium]|jgi:hypothetical protein